MGEGARREKKATRIGDGGGTGGGWRGGYSQGTHVCQYTTQKHRGQVIEMWMMGRVMERGGRDSVPGLASLCITHTDAYTPHIHMW